MAPSLSRRGRRGALALALAFALAGAIAGAIVSLATAAPNRPVVSLTPTVTGSAVSIAVGSNRQHEAIAS